MKKEPVTRFSVSLPPQLLEQFDAMAEAKGYDNRSLASFLYEHQRGEGGGKRSLPDWQRKNYRQPNALIGQFTAGSGKPALVERSQRLAVLSATG